LSEKFNLRKAQFVDLFTFFLIHVTYFAQNLHEKPVIVWAVPTL